MADKILVQRNHLFLPSTVTCFLILIILDVASLLYNDLLTQTAFLPGRNIMEGTVILHETIHELHSKKQDGIIFKIDFEKAYDKEK